MQRKIELSRGAVLWEQGDVARNIAILEKGKLSVHSGERLLGYCWPRMVLGESALLAADGQAATRTASVVAAEDGTLVIEYPPSALRQAVAAGEHPLPGIILTTLVGLIVKDSILLMSQKSGQIALEAPLQGLCSGLLSTLPRLRNPTNWDDFLFDVRFLCGLRDYTEALRARLLTDSDPATTAAAVERASAKAQELYKGHDILPFLEDLIGRRHSGEAGA